MRDLTKPGAGSALPNELMKFTWLTREVSPYLLDRYSERKESTEELMKRVNQARI